MSKASRPHRHTLPRAVRIRSQHVFSKAFADRRRVSDRWVTVFATRNEAGLARLGISVGRRFGPAVRRNRAKRLIREAFRRIRHELPPGLDLIVIPRGWNREPGRDELEIVLRRAADRLASQVSRGEM